MRVSSIYWSRKEKNVGRSFKILNINTLYFYISNSTYLEDIFKVIKKIENDSYSEKFKKKVHTKDIIRYVSSSFSFAK